MSLEIWVPTIFVLVSAVVGIGAGILLSKVAPGDVERDAYTLIRRTKRSN